MRTYNFGPRGSNLTNLFHVTCHEASMITCLQLLEGPLQINLGGGKTLKKIWRDFGQLQILIANISGDIENRKRNSSTTARLRFGEKFR